MRDFLNKLIEFLTGYRDSLPSDEAPMKKKDKKLLGIVIGHTKRSGGAWATAPLSMNEYTYNTEIAKLMEIEAKKQGLEVRVFTRDVGGIRGAYNRVHDWFFEPTMYQQVNRLDKDADVCVIELHFNAATPKARGTETLYDLDPADSYDFAKMVQREMVNVFRIPDRGVKRRVKGDRGYYNLEACKFPSCIVEPAFGSNPLDSQLLLERKEPYAKGLVNAAVEFLKL